MKKVVLFKSVSEDYQKAFSENKYETVFVEPLQFEFVKLKELCVKLLIKDYDGLILTSPRAIETVSKCWAPSKLMIWSKKRIYTVGDASKDRIKLLLGLEAKGSDTGNAENLASLIVNENPGESKFLFPCGNLRAETLPNTLRNRQITVDALTVYETKENENLRNNLMELNKSGNPSCLIFFSPSGCEYIYRQLQTFNNKLSVLPHFAIGNSTAHKIENLGVEIAGVAAKPNAASVLECVEQYYRTLGS